MKHIVSFILLFGCLASCSTYRMPPFATSDAWRLDGNTVSNGDMAVDFGNGSAFPIVNAGDGDELHFITGQRQFNNYDAACARYLTEVLRSIPLTIDSVEVMFADEFMILSTNPLNQWKPDYVRYADGAVIVTQANEVKSDVQPHDELWRNLLADTKRHRIVAIDRLVKNGHHYAIVYILQSEHKSSPLTRCFSYDITDNHNIQAVGTHLAHLLDITINALHSKATAE